MHVDGRKIVAETRHEKEATRGKGEERCAHATTKLERALTTRDTGGG